MKRILAIIISVLFIAALAAGCTAKGMSASPGASKSKLSDGYTSRNDATSTLAPSYSEDGRITLTTSDSLLQQNKKIIRNASCSLTVPDAKEAWDSIVQAVTAAGGYVSAGEQWQNADKYITITATIRIPAGRLDGAIEYLQTLGEVKSLSISSTDVTDSYTDTQLRLAVKRRSLEQYYKYLEAAKDVNEMLEIQGTINSVVEDIEAAEGKLRLWDNLVAESKLEIRIYEEKDPTRERREAEWNAMTANDFGYYVSNGFINVTKTLWSIILWILIFLVWISPIWIVALAIIIPLVLRSKKKKNARAAQLLEAAQAQVENR